jgi:hypothetical protein
MRILPAPPKISLFGLPRETVSDFLVSGWAGKFRNPPARVSNMQVLHFDQINPQTGRVFTFDDPNCFFGPDGIGRFLEPGDPGFVPYDTPAPPPPAPKPKKPFRRKKKTNIQNIPNHTSIMNKFQYRVAPKSGGGFLARPVLPPALSGDDFMAKVAQRASLPVAQCDAVVDALVAEILACGSGCAHTNAVRGKLRFVPTAGGSSASPDGFHNAEDINADIAISLTAETRDAWRATLELERLEDKGLVSPEIDSILSQENGAENHYVPGTLIVLNGDRLAFNKADLTQGVFFRSGNDPEVRATVYGTVTPSSLSVLVPAGLTGPLHVRVAAYINGSVRSFSYMHAITQ